jgi:hypothetical protein
MHQLSTIILSVLAIMALVLFVAVIGGVFVWALWPIVMPVAFPGAVASGLIAKDLSLWHSILLSWLAASLFKSTSTSSNKDK